MPPRLRLLVAEDQLEEAKALARLLESLGHEAHTAGTGQAAVECCRDREVNVAFIDLLLPGANGFEVARQLRALPRPPDLVAITGIGTGAMERVARSVGFRAVLRKPYTIQDVQALLPPSPGGDGGAEPSGGP